MRFTINIICRFIGLLLLNLKHRASSKTIYQFVNIEKQNVYKGNDMVYKELVHYKMKIYFPRIKIAQNSQSLMELQLLFILECKYRTCII